MSDLGQVQNLTFTTQPKTRRHLTRGAFISGTRSATFMQHLWDTGLKKSCSYETLKWEFVNYFGTNDTRTVERYIGRPKQTVSSRGLSTVRINRTSGKVACFDYSNSRKMGKKAGLLESLGYITLKPEERIAEQGNYKITQKTGNWIAVLHHERMNYYTEQTVFEPANPLQESEESSELSKDEMCVSGLLEKNCNETISPRERVGEETVLEVSPNVEAAERTLGREIKKEEEVIDSTHTNQSSKSEAPKTPLRPAWRYVKTVPTVQNERLPLNSTGKIEKCEEEEKINSYGEVDTSRTNGTDGTWIDEVKQAVRFNGYDQLVCYFCQKTIVDDDWIGDEFSDNKPAHRACYDDLKAQLKRDAVEKSALGVG